MKKSPPSSPSPAFFIRWRFYFVLILIAAAVAGLGWRIFDLAILDQHFLRKQGDERVLRMVSTPAFRGMIVDRHGYPLAVSTSVYSAWINPPTFAPDKTALAALAKVLQMKPNAILALVKQKKQREFVYLKRSLAPELAAQIKALAIPGVFLQQEHRRYYPEGEVMAQVIGFTNVDDQGQEGMELGYNEWLQGEPGKKWVIKDRLGRIIADVQQVQEQKPGRELVLSIDRRIQYLAYRELLAGITRYQARAGSAVVLDVKTGEVLAMVNYPSFNPNNRSGQEAREWYRNRAVTDLFEPGSTIKAFSVATALDSERYQPDTMIDTHPGWLRVGRETVKDRKNNGPLTVTQILQLSSNVGVTKMILDVPPNNLREILHKVGFGEITGVGFPGEQNGVLVQPPRWGDFTLATLAFGYGLSVTPLQLARAYAVLANNGVKLPVSLLRQSSMPVGEQVIRAPIAQQMLVLLEKVVSKGAGGEKANVPGYRVAGKTGTAQMASEGGYARRRYISSFVGIAPVSQPRFVVAVVIHEPSGKEYYGGLVAGPVFEKIMEGTLRMMDVPPDKEAEDTRHSNPRPQGALLNK
ncbi:MAG TPA: penicillin-binding protein 2 [Gammaproteobacteria bacterium]|jgi:cell division protein FtsI (penicillin-binding protein 3)|nr:penicillin-binding protein 2 [Gammaproteobacteria bacterium]